MSRMLEKCVEKAYENFAPVAQRYGYAFRRKSITVGGLPCVLFLGNHSSGKSTFVNWLLGGASVQDTGVAPTDDGFTVTVFGDREEDVVGPAAFSLLPQEFKALEAFGPVFLQHLKVKVRNRPILRKICLVDSPGMIDSAASGAGRGYDFAGVVQSFADICDLVFFLFDPEKPGTTGETVAVLSKCLRGIDFKLRVLLNKCDAFTSLYDFTRAYGTLCWNLSRVLGTKDMPKIYTTYSGQEVSPSASRPAFADFNRHRAELLGMLEDMSSRRADSVFAAAHADFGGLSVRMRIVNLVAKKILVQKLCHAAVGTVVTLLCGLNALWIVSQAMAGDLSQFSLKTVLAWLAMILVAGAVGYAAFAWSQLATRWKRRKLSEDLDALFNEACGAELAAGMGDDVRQRWEASREETAAVVRETPLSLLLPFTGARRCARLRVETDRFMEIFEESRKEA